MGKTMTYDEIDALCERLSSLPFQCDKWPTQRNVELVLKNSPKQNLEYMIWVTETAPEPKTDAEKKVRKMLLNLINKSIDVKEE